MVKYLFIFLIIILSFISTHLLGFFWGTLYNLAYHNSTVVTLIWISNPAEYHRIASFLESKGIPFERWPVGDPPVVVAGTMAIYADARPYLLELEKLGADAMYVETYFFENPLCMWLELCGGVRAHSASAAALLSALSLAFTAYFARLAAGRGVGRRALVLASSAPLLLLVPELIYIAPWAFANPIGTPVEPAATDLAKPPSPALVILFFLAFASPAVLPLVVYIATRGLKPRGSTH